MPRHSRSRSGSPRRDEGKRLHLADLNESITRRDVEDTFSKFGRLADVWVASYPPYYGFVVYERSDDANAALKEMGRGYIGKYPIRVTVALPRGSRKVRSPPRRRDDRYGGRGRRDDRGRDDRRGRYDSRNGGSSRDSKRRSRSPRREPDQVSD
uniref:RRM domain-containing protein n=1 Tax=Panagrolaimus sp. JU765 TaxID=591449 RepID=A0AC34Q0U1_9BILA